LTPACTGLLERSHMGQSALGLLKSTFYAENSYAVCLGLFPAISEQFSLETCEASPKSRKIQ